MTRTRIALALPLAAAALLLAGCGSGAHADSPAPATHTAAPVASTTPTAKPGPYTRPEQMLAKVKALPFIHGCESKAAYNADGALSLSCFGRDDETIYLDTFDVQQIGINIAAAKVMPGAHYHVGPGWLVSAQNSQSFWQLVAALS